jgi:hypothetical protein
MESERFAGLTCRERLFSNPWPALLAGLAANIVACLWFRFACLWFHASQSPALPLIFAGLLATGAAVAIGPRNPLVLVSAAFSGLLACCGLAPISVLGQHLLAVAPLWVLGEHLHTRPMEVHPWDSAQLLVAAFSFLALFAAIVVLLPRTVQRIIVSLMIGLHFFGILTAVSSVPPTPPLMNWAWTYVYRPYLQFMYLNNAYHFYSPEPGPGIMVWFYTRYQDGSADWYIIPDPSQNPLTQEYQRRLSLAESTNQLLPAGPVSSESLERRRLAGHSDGIPLHPTVDLSMQHREPNSYSKNMVATYARFIANLKAQETGKTIRSVKVYRVVHNLPQPNEIANGIDPAEKHFYYPYYQGEFTPEGTLIDPQDPYLYWLIPIVKTYDPAGFRAGKLRPAQLGDEQHLVILDLLEVHAELSNKRPSDALPDFVPGGRAEEATKKSAAVDPAPSSVPR